MKSRGGLGREVSSHRSPLSERLEQAITCHFQDDLQNFLKVFYTPFSVTVPLAWSGDLSYIDPQFSFQVIKPNDSLLRINEKQFEQQITSVVATSHHKWPYENLAKEISFAFCTTEDVSETHLFERTRMRGVKWRDDYYRVLTIARNKPLAINIKLVSLTRYKGVEGICRRARRYIR